MIRAEKNTPAKIFTDVFFYLLSSRKSSISVRQSISLRSAKVYEAGNAGTEHKFTARIVEITPSTTVPADIRKILREIDNRAGLLEPQNYNSVYLQMITPRNYLTVPLDAMTSLARNEVFVVADGKIYRRQIKTGVNNGIFIEVFKGRLIR